MKIQLMISDEVYASLLKGSTRVQGSIMLMNPREANFNVHHRERAGTQREYIKLPHGRVSINKETVRLTLNLALNETNIIPSMAILDESEMASNFIQTMMAKGGVA